MTSTERMDRRATLKAMRICRFCLTEEEPLTSIYDKDSSKNSIPLPLQIMACVSIEVFISDGMPQMICKICRQQLVRAYKFKSFCKQSDDALKLYIATGVLKKPNKTIAEVLKVKNDVTEESTSESNEPPKKRLKLDTIEQHENVAAHIEEGEVVHEEEEEEEELVEEHVEENVNDENRTTKEDATNVKLEVRRREEEDEPGEEEEEEDEEMEEEEDEEELSEMVEKNTYDDAFRNKVKADVETNIFPCKQCSRSFPLQQLLDIHMRNHTRERKFCCKSCNKYFFSKYDLAKHETVHTGEKPYECIACSKSFARPTLLHRHEKTHSDLPKYLCTTCDKTFLAKDELARHEQIHKKSRPFQCSTCLKSFAFKQGLERHQETHRADKRFKCNYCVESFDTPAKLARHVTTHAGIRPYPCRYCHRTFLLSHHLTRHMRGHTDEEKMTTKDSYNYKCSECTMKFKRKDGLIGHSTIHSMVSLKCIFCSRQFVDLRMVREHVKTHMYGRIYPCDKCNYSFITFKHLEDHEKASCPGQIDKEISMLENYQLSGENSTKESVDLFTDPLSLEDQEEEEEEEEANNEASNVNETNENVENETSKVEESAIRRSSRQTKIKNYAKFIKDELGSESEQESNEEAEEEQILTPKRTETKRSLLKKVQEETIKPIVKPDGTKTYASKGPKKPLTPSKPVEENPKLDVPATTQASIDLPINKWARTKGEVMEMKIGEKTVKVQKFIMSKAEVEEMARQGKIKMKGGTMLLRKSSIDATKLQSPIATSTPAKIKKSVVDALVEGEKADSSQTKSSDSSEQQAADSKKSVRTYVKKNPGNGSAKIKDEMDSETVKMEEK